MKKRYIYITLVFHLVLIMANKVEAKNTIDLMEYQWKHRLLILLTPSLYESEYQKLKEGLDRQMEAVIDRNFLVFHISESAETKLGNSPLPENSDDTLREKYSIKSGILTVLLIGKDGDVKLRREGRLELDEISY